MKPLFLAEVRKLLTIRSTYIVIIIAFLLTGFFSFWAAFKGVPGEAIASNAAYNTFLNIPIFVAIIAILLVTHEYRFNTIVYTLTASNSRNKVLLSKVLAVLAFSTAFFVIAAAFSMMLAVVGSSMQGSPIPPQHFYFEMLWRGLVYALGFVGIGLLLAVLLRHVVGAIAALMLLPSVEGLFSILLKENAVYLPFASLVEVTNGDVLKPFVAAAVFGAYLVVGWVAAWILFLKRDAN